MGAQTTVLVYKTARVEREELQFMTLINVRMSHRIDAVLHKCRNGTQQTPERLSNIGIWREELSRMDRERLRMVNHDSEITRGRGMVMEN